MASIESVKCPECGAKLRIDEGQKKFFCQYCGCALAIDDDSKAVHVNVDKFISNQYHTKIFVDNTNDKENKIRLYMKNVAFITVVVAVIVATFTFIYIHDDFNITFNYSLMLIGIGTAATRIRGSNLVPVGIALSLILLGSSIVFLFLKDDFNATFLLMVAISLASHGIAIIG